MLRAIFRTVPGERPVYRSLHQIAPDLPPICWLWRDWIPRGMISLLGSVAGAGKSYAAVDAQCCLPLVHHLRKRGLLNMTDALTVGDFCGFSYIIAMARSVLGLSVIQTASEPDRNGTRRLEIGKTNLAHSLKPLGVEFQQQLPAGVRLQCGPPPKPYRAPTKEALFIEFGDSALIFRVRWWLESYQDTRRMFDRVHTALYTALTEAGVEIPFPQRDLYHKVDPDQGDRLVRMMHETRR